MTSQSSLALTALSGLHRALGTQAVWSLGRLRLHVVGASGAYELPGTTVWVELLHFLPSLTRLVVRIIGLDVNANFNTIANFNFNFNGGVRGVAVGGSDQETCPGCAAAGVTRWFEHAQGLFHHHYRASGGWEAPDLIVGFNTGMHEDLGGTWGPTLDAILDTGAPFVFTSYTSEEAEADARVMEGKGARLLLSREQNPLKSLRLLEDHGLPGKFFCASQYWGIARGRG